MAGGEARAMEPGPTCAARMGDVSVSIPLIFFTVSDLTDSHFISVTIPIAPSHLGSEFTTVSAFSLLDSKHTILLRNVFSLQDQSVTLHLRHFKTDKHGYDCDLFLNVRKRALNAFLRHVLERDRHSLHNFRIGAATFAAANDIAEKIIQNAGGWKSSTYGGCI
ncbi:hypothetical protein BV898_17577 [Hypsibius exemplaris]|uniref:Uncharacterized protein n=1 Tax=Hypsibius exemplaris TaxID=2072580 RepID=A0A9X6NFB9_HYPEX|nr:hypothetical protein BV898_17577 [Hypsibius exemplaris]